MNVIPDEYRRGIKKSRRTLYDESFPAILEEGSYSIPGKTCKTLRGRRLSSGGRREVAHLKVEKRSGVNLFLKVS